MGLTLLPEAKMTFLGEKPRGLIVECFLAIEQHLLAHLEASFDGCRAAAMGQLRLAAASHNLLP